MSGTIVISALPAVSAVNATDLLVVVEVGTPNVTKRASVAGLLQGNLASSFSSTNAGTLIASSAALGSATATTFEISGTTMQSAAPPGGFGPGVRMTSTVTGHWYEFDDNGTALFGGGPGFLTKGVSIDGLNGSIGILGPDKSSGYVSFVYLTANTAGTIAGDGAGGVTYGTTSDHRLKTIKGFSDGSDIDRLIVHRGSMIGHEDYERDMFLAHEYQEVIPHGVIGTKDAVDADGLPIIQMLDATTAVPGLVAKVQYLSARISEMEIKLSAMGGS